ncbi:MAG: 30S ribosomal protein S2 [Actinomycetota bacterium]
MAVVTMKELLEAGVHFGHQTRRWNPKMRRFIFAERNGIYIIDLLQTLEGIEESYEFVRDLVARGGKILFVGTKKQISEMIAEQAKRCGMPYVNYRWLGGMLTNFQTIHRRILRLRDLETQEAQGIFEELPKKEALKLRHEMEKLRKNLDGIREMNRHPNAVFVVDTRKEDICVREARKLGIPVVAVVDTNCEPDEVDYIIPGNDDAIRSGALLTQIIAEAVLDGLGKRPPEVIAAAEAAAAGVQLTAGEEQPPAEWEIMLAQQEAETRRDTEELVPEEPPAPEFEETVQPLISDEPLPGEDIEEELKHRYRDDDTPRRR